MEEEVDGRDEQRVDEEVNYGCGIEVERVVGRARSRVGHGGAVGGEELGENGGGDVEKACLNGSGYEWGGHGEGGA